MRETTKMKEILQVYEVVSGQAINLQKSKILFSKNTLEADKEAIKKCFPGDRNNWEWKVLENAFNDWLQQKSYVWLFEG
jgi:hypothetical protein